MKKHIVQGQTIIAAADISVLGKKLSDGKRVLDLEKFRSFYEGEATDVAGLASALKSCDSANLVGKLSVGAAIDSNLASEGSIVVIGGVPHLQLYRIGDTGKAM